ncbi:hypothetical protein WA158_001230 [Blastocystis sp. Blastoise]
MKRRIVSNQLNEEERIHSDDSTIKENSTENENNSSPEKETEERIEFYTEEDNALYPILCTLLAVSSFSSIYQLWKSRGIWLDEGRLAWEMLANGDFKNVILLLCHFSSSIVSIYFIGLIAFKYLRSYPKLINLFKNIYCIIILSVAAFFSMKDHWPIIPSIALTAQSVVTTLKIYSFLSIVFQSNNNSDSDIYPSFKEYLRFHFSPSLVFIPSMEYTHSIRISYVIQKLFIVFLCLLRLYTSVVEMYPFFVKYHQGEITFLEIYISILPRIYVAFFLLFGLLFMGICPLFAELTRWPDRRFFSYWWTSCSISEFSRLWNKPVHQFLYTHVYKPLYKDQHYSKFFSTLITYVISAFGHEYVLFFSTHAFRPVISLVILLETPLDYLLLFIIKKFPNLKKVINVLFHLAISFFMSFFLLVYIK